MLAATVLCLASLGWGPTDRPDVFRGTVVEKGTNRPLAGVSVRADGDFDGPSATTDARGRFDGIPASKSGGLPVDGHDGPTLMIRAEDDRAWPWTAPGDNGKPRGFNERERREILAIIYDREVRTRWRGQGPGATLVAECPSVGVMEVVVRGPDGRPLADAPIVVIPEPGPSRPGAVSIRLPGRTDHAGAFRIRSFEGGRRFDVLVPGIGRGSTGTIEAIPNRTVRAEVPPLVRFARIEGRLDDALKGADVKVLLGSGSPPTPCDAEGRFTLTDLRPGRYERIGVRRDGKWIATLPQELGLAPGQILRDLVLRPAPPPEVEKNPSPPPTKIDWDQAVAWVEGTVSDERGRPLAGATVYVHVSPVGLGSRRAAFVKKTTTDREGRYRFEGRPINFAGPFSVTVAAKDRPPIVAVALASGKIPDGPARLDVAVGARGSGGGLAVRIVRNGRPVPRADVYLWSAAIRRIFPRFPGAVSPESREARKGLSAALVPRAVAGADGVARFKNLAPGVYEVVDTRPVGIVWREGPFPSSVANEIDVPPGGRVETTVAIDDAPAPTRFRLLDPDGAPLANREIPLGFGRGRATMHGTLKTDERGEGEYPFNFGPWTVEFRYRNDGINVFRIEGEPFYQAGTVVAVSPVLAQTEPIVLRASVRKPGSVKVRLLGPDGAPARGVASLGPFNDSSLRGGAGTVDEQGWIRFAGIASGDYRVGGVIDGAADVPRPRPGPNRLADAELMDRTMVPERKATVEAERETVVELRAEAVGYVRATIHPAADRSPSDYTVWFDPGLFPGQRPTTFEVATSEDRTDYLFGPFPPGRWPMIVTGRSSGVARPVTVERVVVVEPGRVVHIDVAPPASPDRPLRTAGRRIRSLGPGMAELMDPGDFGAAVTVFMPDGTTPAFGARASFITTGRPAGGRVPILLGTADAAGRLSWTWNERFEAGSTEGPEPVRAPTVLAWGPDGGGPAVATFRPGEPLRLTLPATSSATGRVAIAGAAAGGDSRIRVAVVAEGNDAVAVAMGRETTADPDGRFRLAGLVPGRYVVQAVRDGIWTSKPVPLVIEAGRDAGPIELDVPAPGATIALRLVDRAGGPVAAGYSIRRGDGPLVDPATIDGRTDERGEAVVRGLAAGVFALAVEGDAEPRALDVPPFRPGAGPLDVRVEVARPGP